MGWSDDFLISEKACDGSGKVVEEWTRCCCGRYKIYSGERGVLVNDTLHEPFGIAGNFCGPDIKHRIRDIENQYTALSERHQRLVEAAREFLRVICSNTIQNNESLKAINALKVALEEEGR